MSTGDGERELCDPIRGRRRRREKIRIRNRLRSDNKKVRRGGKKNIN